MVCDGMRFSEQHKLILLILLRRRTTPMRLSEIVNYVERQKQKTPQAKFVKRRVLSASFSRSIVTLHNRELLERQAYWRGFGWQLTPEGVKVAREINRELKRQLEKLEYLSNFLV
jgi:CTP-dependent riboflavin kinase